MNEKMIINALLKGERVSLECKKAKSEIFEELWNTYSAFANFIGFTSEEGKYKSEQLSRNVLWL